MVLNRIRNVCNYFLMITLFILLIIPFSFLVDAVTLPFPSFANGPKIWRIAPVSDWSPDILVSPILANATFLCAFQCSFEGDSCQFVISVWNYTTNPPVVWSANRNNPVDTKALLELTSEGQLILKDADDNVVWSVGKSVSRLSLSAEGNLMLLNKTNHIVWQSFDHPTDSLVLGQRLVSGQKLRASVSPLNSSEGSYAFGIINGLLTAYMDTDPSQYYYKGYDREAYDSSVRYYAEFQTQRFGGLNVAFPGNYIQLGSDGHLKAYKVNSDELGWTDVLDIDRCSYPSACGNYGVCLQQGCKCPEAAYFRPISVTNIELGCYAISPISCQLSQYHSFVQLPGEYSQSTYNFAFSDRIKEEDCKEACLKNCSCKAVLYTEGDCHFLSEIFSMKKIDSVFGDNVLASNYSNSAFIKVQNVSVSHNISSLNFSQRKGQKTEAIVGSTLGAIFGVFLICILIFITFRKRFQEVEEDYLDNMLGMPIRFSYEELRNATKNFSNKLGEGGFGSVFHGVLPSGSEVAVKLLVGFGPVNKSFIAEVQTIGSIHHCNLVTLVGFCAEKLNRLLVYEYMANGSLDRWIFNKNQDNSLGWQIRKKIILDIAKGLAYLHEDCNQKIIHLDIKPQNILLDHNFNAKVSDFGLSKLIGKDQSHVFTGMRGTPGYMAPEWLSSSITEKADVYSFGTVVLEILCGCRNFDASEEEDRHVVGVFRRKQEEDQLMDLVDKCSDDMQSNAVEVVEMMKVAAWCLQTEYARRPSMSTVVKLFEGAVDDMGEDMSIGLVTPDATETYDSSVLPSMLSGPR